jgi:hypothetical protein
MQTPGYGKYNMKVLNGWQVRREFINPLYLFHKLAFGAMPVAARVVRLPDIPTVVATINVPAQCSSTALHNCIEGF